MAGMLDDVKVLDFTTNAAGPVASAEMSDYGAQVIKIESMNGGPERTYVPILEGKSLTHAWVNRGKKSITLNLKDPRAIEIVKALAKDADVLIESNRPGVMKRLGLDYETLKEINPSLIYCSLPQCQVMNSKKTSTIQRKTSFMVSAYFVFDSFSCDTFNLGCKKAGDLFGSPTQ